MRSVRWTISVLAWFALSGCATNTATTVSQAGISPKRVAVVSIVGETATLKYIGLTVFTNKERYVSVRGWQLDDKLEAALVRVLSASPASSFVTLPIDRESTLRDYNSRTLRPNWSVTVPALVDAAKAQQADALLLVTPGLFDYNFGERMPFSGLGVMSRGAFGAHPSSVTAYLGGRLHLIDINTGKTVAGRSAAVNLDVSQWSTYAAPAVGLDPKHWYTEFEDVNPTQAGEISKSFELMSQVILANAQRLFGLR